jgi:MscS family membrane protein
MILFKAGTDNMEGRVERVGWNQIRLRTKDTRAVYIPNSLFVNAAVTNIERITHRKVEYIIRIRIEDFDKMGAVIGNIKQRLLELPKLDSLTQPFRIHFTSIGNNWWVSENVFLVY